MSEHKGISGLSNTIPSTFETQPSGTQPTSAPVEASDREMAFEKWWATGEWDGCNEHSIAHDGFMAGYEIGARRGQEEMRGGGKS